MNISPFDWKRSEPVIQLFKSVFSASEGVSEGKLIGELVRNLISSTSENDLFGFIAENKGEIIGAIFFSRLSLTTGQTAFILSPVAVSTTHQGKGIGQQLINYGIAALNEKNVEVIVTYGDPDYYSKVGFKQISEEIIKAPFDLSHPHGWLAQSLTNEPLTITEAKSTCVKALNKQIYW